MKKPQKNNPVVVGMLGLVFLSTVGMTINRMRGMSEASTPAPAGDAKDAPATDPAKAGQPGQSAGTPSASKPTAPIVVEQDRRDPFSHPSLAPKPPPVAPENPPLPPGNSPGSLPKSPGGMTAEGARQTVPPSSRQIGIPQPGSTTMLPGIPVHPPLGVRPLDSSQTDPSKRTAGNSANRTADNAPLTSTDAAEAKLAQSLKLTAVIQGEQPAALVDRAGKGTQTVRVGEKIGSLKVAAIRAKEVVLEGSASLWTIPLNTENETAPSNGMQNSTPPVIMPEPAPQRRGIQSPPPTLNLSGDGREKR